MNTTRPQHQWPVVLFSILGLLACTEHPERSLPTAPAPAISDAAHTGTPGFYFAAPLGDVSTATGTFDATLEPVIDICLWVASSCSGSTAHFDMRNGAERVKLLAADQLYGVNWKTAQNTLAAGQTYRIHVSVAGTILGYADIRLAKSGSSVPGTYDVQAGRSLPIRFRIERGVVTTIGAAGGVVRSADGNVTLDVPSGALGAPTGISAIPVQPTSPHARIVPGTVYDFKPEGTSFGAAAMLTIQYDPVRLPAGVSETSLAIGHFIDGSWVVQPASAVNTTNHTVTALIIGFSSYAILGDLSPAGPLAYTSQSGTSDRDVFIRDGSVRQLTSGTGNDGSPDWLGTQVLMHSDRAGSFDVWRLGEQAGSPPANVTASVGAQEIDPRWSPDGSRIAFVQLMGGADNDIWVMNADGTGRVNLTANAATDGAPAWSPDGTRIAFHSNRSGNTQVLVMNADGTGVTQLTSDATWGSFVPDWSPDGSRLVFSRMIVGTDADLWVMNSNGTGAARLTSGPPIDYNPAWSPDGSQVAFERFASTVSGRADIWLVTSDGAMQSPVASLPAADERSPAWKKQPSIPSCGPADEVMALVNGHRVSNGLPALGLDSRLMAAARRHSLDMAATGVLSHTGSDGTSFAQRILQAGYGAPLGEVIANAPTNAANVFTQWRTSAQAALLFHLQATHIGASLVGSFWTVTLGQDPSPPVPATSCFGPLPAAPVLEPVGNLFVDPGQSQVLTVRASDANGDNLGITLLGAPAFASLVDHGDGTATLTLSPSALDAGVYNAVQIVASDGILADVETITIRVGNRLPTVGVGANVDPFLILAGETANVLVQSTDLDGDPIALQVSNLPAFTSFVDNGDGTGMLTISPPTGTVTSATLTVTTSDGLGTTSITQTIQVIPPACGVGGDMANLINAQRAHGGHSALLLDTRLIQAAAQHSADMAATGVLSHTGSDGSSFPQRITAAGYGSPSGELIANVSALAAVTFDFWRTSGPQLGTIQNFAHRHVGVGVSGTWWTVTFGSSSNPPQQPMGCVP